MKKTSLGQTLSLLKLIWCLAAGVSVALGTVAVIMESFRKNEECGV